MAYPKDYLNSNILPEEGEVFVIMPFSSKFDAVYAEIKQVCLEMLINCTRVDENFSNKAIINNILEGISRAEIVIADITDNNANVFYELGIAHSIKDEDSVITLTQEIDKCPFDIKHKTLLHYSLNNIFKFKDSLKKIIAFSRENTKKRNFLRIYLLSKGIKNTIIEKLINVAESYSQKKYITIYNILSQKKHIGEFNSNEIFHYLCLLEEYNSGVFKEAIKHIKLDILTGDQFDSFRDYINTILLDKRHYDLILLNDSEELGFITELCFKLITKNINKSEAINWLVDYLHNYRMGRIDIVRTKIEYFFVLTNEEDINAAVINMLKSNNLVVRESAADIAGQKNLTASIDSLINTIKNETNPHVVRSCITALTRLNVSDATPIIYEWMIKNKDKWGNQAVSKSLPQIAISALEKLDKKGGYYRQLLTFIEE